MSCGVVDPNHPIFEPRPDWEEGEEWWEYKERLRAWARRRTKRKPMSRSTRRAVFECDGNKCVMCGAEDRLAVDHIYPWSLGGADVMENYQTLCTPCNARKSNTAPAGADVEGG